MKKRIAILMFCAIVIGGCAEKDEGEQASQSGNTETNAAEVTKPKAPATTAQVAEATFPTKLGDPAYPLAELTWVKGDPVAIASGKVYVVEFWATWCPPCRESIPHLTALQKKYADRAVIIGITNESPDVVKPFVQTKGDEMDYNVAIDAIGNVNKGYMRAFGQGGIPTAFIVDTKGKVVWHGHPMVMDDVLDQVLAGTYSVPG